ncbi:murein biosynthesis integral membrane protein MurJ [Candidatus Daviesbacteria bacterium RIFCSPHIGHO2_02_FULL_39_12]|uniref:Probable lipid II flippase MurJ n=2 Tax=Candidatus Daviesiibacteriota TaxID=1752718 RepID=A0A1F5JDG5_9BACT|nr:MAG: murein biosynthesis integral membrane protein MurJ [Candidatus Daviesbacteria bacterium RIFCSPHIGHO2_02_FULL_39_12]OGE72629.1 MAG: murein biosynthesis integral membrane protein MurJ [Candidatus Daviesbacteria bacterium RIFCSPLOWO2_02_FULL_38_15]
MSKLFKASLIITIFFGINKIVALLRQAIIARQFGLTSDIDAFNVANNLPDLLFSLISGGALALAFIPVLTEYLDKKGRDDSWRLFSQIANLVFLTTAVLSIIVAVFTNPLISSPIGVAPGFTPAQQALTANLMRLNLIATLVFSLSGLVMAALQSNKHFLLPAIAPILYNVGQIVGAVFLAPLFGVYGLVYGIILGSILHLGVQIPGMVHYRFRWTPLINLKDKGVQKVLALMGPRILTVLFIQIIFLTRDNLASRLHEGAVTALTYGYFILQVPETLIGTAIATALLPTLSQFADRKNQKAFTQTLNKTIRVIIALTLIVTIISSVSLDYLLKSIFNFNQENTNLLAWTTRAYLIGLVTQSLLEVATRAFYAKQDARTPFIITLIRMILYILIAVVLFNPLGAIGLALADSITVSLEVVILLFLLAKTMPGLLNLGDTIKRVALACIVSVLIFYAVVNQLPIPKVFSASLGLLIAGASSWFFIKREIKMLLKL